MECRVGLLNLLNDFHQAILHRLKHAQKVQINSQGLDLNFLQKNASLSPAYYRFWKIIWVQETSAKYHEWPYHLPELPVLDAGSDILSLSLQYKHQQQVPWLLLYVP